MGFFTGSIFSQTLGMDTQIGVILPQDARGADRNARPATLILLHGLSDNYAAWGFRSRILSYAEAHRVAVIMPEVQRSFYQDMKYGEHYFTYITEELPDLAGKMFNISVAPKDLMVAGLSMGGYGALRCGLTYPERYRAIGAFSSACDIVRIAATADELGTFGRIANGIFGDPVEVPDASNLYKLSERVSTLPFMMTCGTEDSLFPDNEAFFANLVEKGFNATFDKWAGNHEWSFWDVSIQMFLDRYAPVAK